VGGPEVRPEGEEAGPEASLGDLLRARGWFLALAESCTGGLVGHLVTNVPGSSGYFLAGYVTYGNRAKTHMLGVEETLLERYGAVSGQVAARMARGAREASGAQVGLAVTGIAGPGGATSGKPVGLVWMAVDGPLGTRIAKGEFMGTRLEIKEQAARAALRLLGDYCRGG
jgi:PncC family amidohydrolase